jgi:hypothetical protein
VTAPAGYIRSRTARERSIDRAWAALRSASARGHYLATSEIAEAADASLSVVKRLTQAARDAGWLEVIVEDVAGAVARHLYRLTPASPADAPVLRLDDRRAISAVASGGGLSGNALRRLRLERGWSLAETARQLGIRDKRTVRRYEAAAQLPPPVAERVEALGAKK